MPEAERRGDDLPSHGPDAIGRSVRKLLALTLLLARVTHPSWAAAAPPEASAAASDEFSDFSLEFSAPSGCPQRAEFETELLSRTITARLRAAEAGTLALGVTLARDGWTFTGVLAITLPDGARSQRQVEAPTCHEASLSLAVIASLVLEVYRQQRTLPAEPVEEEAPEPEAESAPAPPADEPEPAPAEPPAPPAAPVVEAPAAEPARPTRLNLGIFGALTLETAVAESPPFGALAGVHAERRSDGVWSPSARLGALFTADGTSNADAASADLRLIAARLDLCPLRLAATSALSFVPCADVDVGSLRGSTDSAPNSTVRNMLWLTLGAAMRAELALGQVVSLEAFASGRRLARHDRFVLVNPENPAQRAVLYDVPAWSVGFGAGISVRIF